MQKLSEKFKNTPTSTSLACGSVSQSLNKDDDLSVIDKVRSDNNSEENQRQHDGLNVIVLNKNGKPLMPCKPAKARHLLEQSKAKVVSGGVRTDNGKKRYL